MKTHLIIGLCSAASAVFSQTNDDVRPDTSSVITTARILGGIPDGTPPPPQPPKPEYHISAQDVLSTTSHQQGGRTITIRKIKPIALPLPPTPGEAVPAEMDTGFSRRIAEYREEHPKSRLLFLGATVFRSKDSPPRTLVRYWPEGAGGDITFWSSADFSLIAGGINSFIDSAGDTHHMLMGWGNVDIERMAELYAAKGRKYDAPDLPEFPEGKAAFEITGDRQPTVEEVTVIQSLQPMPCNLASAASLNRPDPTTSCFRTESCLSRISQL
jgi:hypothetical protein